MYKSYCLFTNIQSITKPSNDVDRFLVSWDLLPHIRVFHMVGYTTKLAGGCYFQNKLFANRFYFLLSTDVYITSGSSLEILCLWKPEYLDNR